MTTTQHETTETVVAQGFCYRCGCEPDDHHTRLGCFHHPQPELAQAIARRAILAGTEHLGACLLDEGRELDGLTALHTMADETARVTGLWVSLARERGASWAQVGQALGMSRQAAHERFSR